jgi:hypothetical protein
LVTMPDTSLRARGVDVALVRAYPTVSGDLTSDCGPL